jgi:hypothetical protein
VPACKQTHPVFVAAIYPHAPSAVRRPPSACRLPQRSRSSSRQTLICQPRRRQPDRDGATCRGTDTESDAISRLDTRHTLSPAEMILSSHDYDRQGCTERDATSCTLNLPEKLSSNIFDRHPPRATLRNLEGEDAISIKVRLVLSAAYKRLDVRNLGSGGSANHNCSQYSGYFQFESAFEEKHEKRQLTPCSEFSLYIPCCSLIHDVI